MVPVCHCRHHYTCMEFSTNHLTKSKCFLELKLSLRFLHGPNNVLYCRMPQNLFKKAQKCKTLPSKLMWVLAQSLSVRVRAQWQSQWCSRGPSLSAEAFNKLFTQISIILITEKWRRKNFPRFARTDRCYASLAAAFCSLPPPTSNIFRRLCRVLSSVSATSTTCSMCLTSLCAACLSRVYHSQAWLISSSFVRCVFFLWSHIDLLPFQY